MEEPREIHLYRLGEKDPTQIMFITKDKFIINEYGYTLCWLTDESNEYVVFYNKKYFLMTEEQYLNFTRERKLKKIL